MRILYGVVGEGMGHATRSRVVLEHLVAAGHVIHIVVSGRAYDFLKNAFRARDGVTIQEIEGLSLEYEQNRLDLGSSIASTLRDAPAALARNLQTYRNLVTSAFAAEVVVSDFESFAYLYGINNRIPVISIDNMQIINRCHHDEDVTDEKCASFQIAKTAVKVKLPGAYHYLVSSFFFPVVRKPRTSLVPPILRDDILAAKREPGNHILVYQTTDKNEGLVEILKTLPFEFRFYGMRRTETHGNVILKDFSQTGFVDDLRTARAVIAGGGYSLMSEAVHLGVPMLSVPILGQYEQELNARYLGKLGYGDWAAELNREALKRFLSKTSYYSEMLKSYPRQNNQMLFDCVDGLLTCVAAGLTPPDRIAGETMGKFESLSELLSEK